MNEHWSNLCPFISNFLLSTFDRNKDWCSEKMLAVAPTNIQYLLPKMDTWELERRSRNAFHGTHIGDLKQPEKGSCWQQ